MTVLPLTRFQSLILTDMIAQINGMKDSGRLQLQLMLLWVHQRTVIFIFKLKPIHLEWYQDYVQNTLILELIILLQILLTQLIRTVLKSGTKITRSIKLNHSSESLLNIQRINSFKLRCRQLTLEMEQQTQTSTIQ